MKFSIIGVAVVAVASSGFAAVSTSLDVRQPLQNSTGVTSDSAEVAGPRSVVKVFVPGGLGNFVTDGQPINRARIEGLDFGGAVVSSLAISETILEAPTYDNVSGTNVTLEFGASANVEAFFSNDDIALVRIRVTSADRDPVTDGVETAFNSDSEAQDECLFADNDGPQLTAAYRDDFDVLYLVFNEPMANGNGDNSENQTNQQFVAATDIQVNSQNSFDASTPTITGGFTLISGFYDGAGRMVLHYQLEPGSTAQVGSFVRMAGDEFGNPTHNVYRDVAGNDGFQQGEPGIPTVEGVEVLGGFPPGIRGSYLWVDTFGIRDFNSTGSWIPNAAPTYDKDLRMNIAPSSFAFVEFSEQTTAAQSLWTDGFISMSVGDSINNPNGILYLHGQESFGGVFTTALLLRDAFTAEPNPIALFSLDQGIIDTESMAFRQDFGGSISATVINDGELRTGSLLIGEPDGSAFMQLTAGNGGRLLTGYDNGIGARTTQVPSVIVNQAGSITIATGSEWLSLGDIDVLNSGQIGVTDTARAVFSGDVTLGSGTLFYHQQAWVTNVAPPEGPGSYILNDVNFPGGGLMYSERLTVEGGRTFEAPEFTVGLFGPKFAGVAVFDQLVVRSGSQVGASNLFSVAFDGRVLLPDFDGVSPLPVEDNEAQIVIDGGTLELRFASEFDPPLGSEFPIISGSSFSGRFANHILPSFNDGRVAIVEYPIPRAGNGIVYQGATLRIVDLESLLGFNPDPEVTNIGEAPVRADAGDLDGDGDTDLAVIFDAGGEAGSVSVLLNRGTIEGVWQGFEQAAQFPTGPKPTAIAIGDFVSSTVLEQASDLDIAVVCAGDDSLRLYLNAGTGQSFEAIGPIPTEAYPTDVDAEDFNQDGFTDLSVVCRDADVIQIFINNGPGTALLGGVFQAPQNAETGDEPVDCDPVDLDNDKDIDLASGSASGGVSTSTNDGDGGFGVTSNSEIGSPVDAIATGDLDLDGDADSAVVSRSTGLLSILVNDGNGDFDLFSTFAVGADAGALAIIDYDGDGDADISVVSIPEGETEHRVTVLRNDSPQDGPLIFTPSVQLTNQGAPSDPKVVYSVDVDGDGRPDIVTIDDRVKGEGGVVSSYLNVSGPLPLCAGDANADRRVDGKDLQTLLSMYGQFSEPNTGANFNSDSFIDGRDLSVLLANYGNVCELPTAID